MAEVMRKEIIYVGKNVGTNYISECNLRIVDLADPDEHILVTILSGFEFCHPHARAGSL